MENKHTSIYPLHPEAQSSCAGDQRGGLTKREYFAGLAMQGLLVNYLNHGHYGNDGAIPMIAQKAVEQADELLKALES